MSRVCFLLSTDTVVSLTLTWYCRAHEKTRRVYSERVPYFRVRSSIFSTSNCADVHLLLQN